MPNTNDCLEALSRRIQFENFIRRVAFSDPLAACLWARASAQAAFTAFLADGRTILVSCVVAFDTTHRHSWHWTECVCRVRR